MANIQPLVLRSDALEKTQPSQVELMWVITGAKTVRLGRGQSQAPVKAGFDAASLTTAICDALLSAEVAQPAGDVPGDTMFDATALGADSFGALIDMQGQARKAVRLEYVISTNTGGGGATVLVHGVVEGADGQLTVSENSTGMAVSPAGNLYLRLAAISNLDIATAGSILVKLHFHSK